MKFSNILKELIADRDVTQSSLAEYLGITRSRLNNYISGRSEPDFELLKNIAGFFNVSIDYLLGRTGQVTISDNKDFVPEIVKGREPPKGLDPETQWVPIYLSVPSFKGKHEDSRPEQLGWIMTKRNAIGSAGFREHYALLVNDTTMSPELMPGDIAYVQPSYFLHSIIPSNKLYSIRLYHSDHVGLAIKRCFVLDNILLGFADDKDSEPMIYNMEHTIFEPIVGYIIGVWRSTRPENILKTLL